MKKLIALLICIALLTATGCSKQKQAENNEITETPQMTDNPQTTTQPETEVTQVSDYVPEQVPMAAISLPVSETNAYTEDDVLLFTYRCQTISLIIPDSEIEQKVILDLQNRLDGFYADAQEISDRAKTDYIAGQDWTNYFFEVLYKPMRIDLSVLSLYGENTSWVGGAHPSKNCISSNYDLVTGDVLTLGSILTHEDALETLCDLLIEEVADIKAEKYLFTDYEDIIHNRFSQNESYNETWYFSNEGLSFYFSPYEIAPYSSGVITITIPYEKLTGIIEDRYFPAEREIANGTLNLVQEADANLEDFTQIAEVILDSSGEMLFLYTNLSVHNVMVEIGALDENGNFIHEKSVFAAPILTPGDAIMLKAHTADDQSTIKVSYQTNDQTITQFIQTDDQGNVTLK